jgi:hypothetical protein
LFLPIEINNLETVNAVRFLTEIVIMLLLFHLLTIFGVSPKPQSGP